MTFTASAHPRVAAGGAGGGQFAPLSYNSKANKGTGYGSKHGDTRVKTAQAALNKAHITDANGKPLVLDGKLGPKTTAALKAYQKAHGLRVDGKITTSLLAMLKAGGGKNTAKAKPGSVHKKAALKAKKTFTRTTVTAKPMPKTTVKATTTPTVKPAKPSHALNANKTSLTARAK